MSLTQRLSIACSVASLTALAMSPAHAATAEFLSAKQKKAVLRAVDNICGDTWCEGDYNFRFNKLFCSSVSKSCRVVFQYFPHGEPEKAVGKACDIKRVAHYVHLVDPRTRSLKDGPYGQLTTCIGKIR